MDAIIIVQTTERMMSAVEGHDGAQVNNIMR